MKGTQFFILVLLISICLLLAGCCGIVYINNQRASIREEAIMKLMDDESIVITVIDTLHMDAGKRLTYYGRFSTWEYQDEVNRVYLYYNGTYMVIDNEDLYLQCVGHKNETIKVKIEGIEEVRYEN